jgi:hypothetical protein
LRFRALERRRAHKTYRRRTWNTEIAGDDATEHGVWSIRIKISRTVDGPPTLVDSARTHGVKRAPTKRKKQAKVPEPFIPIVDAVVEMVFARLTEAAAKAKRSEEKKSSPRPTSARQRSSKPEEQGGLAGAVADLLLAGLTRDASNPKRIKAARKKRPKRQRSTD